MDDKQGFNQKIKGDAYLQSICKKPREMKYAIFQTHHVETFSYLLFLQYNKTLYECKVKKILSQSRNSKHKRKMQAERIEHYSP